MNDATIADVDTMMAVERARGDEMRGERRFSASTEERIAREGPLVRALMDDRIVAPPVHTFRYELLRNFTMDSRRLGYFDSVLRIITGISSPVVR
jgi:hypothetical protein